MGKKTNRTRNYVVQSIAVVMPVYNEGSNIISTLKLFKRHVQTPAIIYLVYDHEKDSTIPVVKRYARQFPNVFLVKNRYGRGVLNAIKTGLETTQESAILVSMADGSDDYTRVDGMVELLKQGASVVAASRYSKGGKQLGGTFFKKLLSRVTGVSLHYLTGLPTLDITNNFKLYSRKVIDKITIESTGGFEIAMEITSKAFLQGFKIAEVPTVWRDRQEGTSNFKLASWLPNYLYWYLYLLKNSWFQNYGTK